MSEGTSTPWQVYRGKQSNPGEPDVINNSKVRHDLPPLLFIDPRPVRHTERISDLMNVLFEREE